MDIRVRLGRNVRRLRRDRGWSQEEFADLSGYHRTYISGIERGIRNPTVTVIETLAKSLKTTASDLLS